MKPKKAEFPSHKPVGNFENSVQKRSINVTPAQSKKIITLVMILIVIICFIWQGYITGRVLSLIALGIIRSRIKNKIKESEE